jgi:hypothetical protein
MAVIAYECLSGQLPFVGDSFEEVARLHQEEPPTRLTELRDDVPLLVADAVEQALRKRPTERFANVLDFVTVLRGGPPQGAEPLAPSEEPRGAPQILTIQPPTRRFPLPHVAAAAAGAAAVLLVVLILLRGSGGEEPISSDQFVASAPATAPPIATLPAPVPAPPPAAAEPARRQPAGAVGRLPPAEGSRQVAAAPRRATPAPAGPRSDSARLFVSTRPWGVLFVDGVEVGNTPKANLGLTPGVHVIRVVRDGFEPWEQEIEVAAGEEVRMTDVVLTPRQP